MDGSVKIAERSKAKIHHEDTKDTKKNKAISSNALLGIYFRSSCLHGAFLILLCVGICAHECTKDHEEKQSNPFKRSFLSLLRVLRAFVVNLLIVLPGA